MQLKEEEQEEEILSSSKEKRKKKKRKEKKNWQLNATSECGLCGFKLTRNPPTERFYHFDGSLVIIHEVLANI